MPVRQHNEIWFFGQAMLYRFCCESLVGDQSSALPYVFFFFNHFKNHYIMPGHQMGWRNRYSSSISRKAGGRIISGSTVVGKITGSPVIALSVTVFMILDCSRFQRAPSDDNFDRSASSSAHLTFAIPTQASSSRWERSALNLLLPSITTSSERSRGSVTGCDLSLL